MTDLKNTSLKGKKILLGITGSIAAYKSAMLCRLFVKAGAEVKVLMTKGATHFISPLTLSTLSKHDVIVDIMSEDGWNNHVELGLWADAFVIAPITANSLAKLATGLCDNALTAVYLSARCPVFVAPAMDIDMWIHPRTKANIKTVEADGVHIIPVGDGELASGLVGKGRMAEVDEIGQYLADYFSEKEQIKPLAGKKCIVTAGPTREALDPVRFISNRSTGTMGIKIAERLAVQGGDVKLILGPSTQPIMSLPNLEVIRVESAQDMYEACHEHWDSSHVGVLAAAVADYKPRQTAQEKIKKKEDDMSLPLARTQDIAASLGKIKKDNQLLVGFALETQNEVQNAQGKLKRKNFDFIVLNSLKDKGAGFGTKANKVNFIFAEAPIKSFPLKDKEEVAEDIVDQIKTMMGI